MTIFRGKEAAKKIALSYYCCGGKLVNFSFFSYLIKDLKCSCLLIHQFSIQE
jgi:hypothetical protein